MPNPPPPKRVTAWEVIRASARGRPIEEGLDPPRRRNVTTANIVVFGGGALMLVLLVFCAPFQRFLGELATVAAGAVVVFILLGNLGVIGSRMVGYSRHDPFGDLDYQAFGVTSDRRNPADNSGLAPEYFDHRDDHGDHHDDGGDYGGV